MKKLLSAIFVMVFAVSSTASLMAVNEGAQKSTAKSYKGKTKTKQMKKSDFSY